MDIFLVQNGVIQNIVVVSSLDDATKMYPGVTIVVRDETNAEKQIGDTL